MTPKKFRWSKVYESSEEELIDLLEARGEDSKRVHLESGDDQTEQQNDDTITIWCAEGSLVAKVDTTSVSLQPGDALRIDAGRTYALHPGFADCAFYLTR